jgi:ribonuclease D
MFNNNRGFNNNFNKSFNFNQKTNEDFNFNNEGHDSYVSKFASIFIDDNHNLQNAIDTLYESEKIFISFEYQKIDSYNEKLSLLCISNDKDTYIIDMMQEDIDDDMLQKFLFDDKIQKVIYDAKKALSTLYSRYKRISKNIFDLHIASMLCNPEKNCDYRDVLFQNFGTTFKVRDPIKINYKLRPLSPKSIDRVTISAQSLRLLYNFLYKELKTSSRTSMHNDIVAEFMQDPSVYEKSVENAWLKIQFNTTRMDIVRRIKKIAEWRELTAKRMNISPYTILSDATLIDIAEKNPTSHEELSEVKNLNKSILRAVHSRRIISAITAAQKVILEKTDIEADVQDIPNKYIPLVDMFKILLRVKSQQYNISATLIANNRDLAVVALFDNPKVKCMSGWRFEAFGQDALRMKNGEIGLIYESNQFIIFENQKENMNYPKKD